MADPPAQTGPATRGRARPVRAALLTLLSSVALVLAARAALLSFDPVLDGSGALLWLSLLPLLLVLGVLFGLSGKLLFTAWTGYWVLWALFFGNAEKLEHLSRSLRPGDFSALPTFLGSPGLFLPYLDGGGSGLWWAGGAVLLGLVLLVVEPRSLRLWWPLRLGMAVACGLALVSLVRDPQWHDRFAHLYDDEFHLWAPEPGMQAHGLVAGLLRLSWAAHVGHAEPDTGAVQRFIDDNAVTLAQRAARPVPARLPDLVVVQSESLFDPADLRGITPEDSLPQFRALAKKGLSGRLQVPTFAGGTIRTEFELLSGYPLDAFPAVEYPYLGIALHTPTALPVALARFGYEASAVHPFQREFWNREDALRVLGFDAMHFYDEFLTAPTHGWYVTDGALFDRILDMLPTDDDTPPQLVFAITMENHGPWSTERPIPADTLAAQPIPDGLSDEAQRELRNYLALLDSGDRALGPFAEALLARTRPTLLLVYGDHLPDLGATYEELGFDNDDKPWKQTVPYLLVGNVGYPQAHLDSESEFLASLLLDALQVPYDGYFALNAAARDNLAFGNLGPDAVDYVRHVLRSAAQHDYDVGGMVLEPTAAAP